MPNGMRNWNFKQVEALLLGHFFKLVNVDGSHYFYRGKVDGKDKLAYIHYHTKSIIPDTLRSIIHKSGIPKEIWMKWARGEQEIYKGAERWH